MSLKKGRGMPAAVIGIGVLLLMSFLVVTQSYADPAKWNGYVESATYYRDEVGWSKARLGAQLEGKKDVGNVGIFKKVAFNVAFRVSYDAVYDINDDEFGYEAGGPVMLENASAAALPLPASVPHGGGIINHTTATTVFGLPPTNAFGFDTTRNPNQGMVVLGDHLHSANGGVTFGVPVRPFDKDPRGSLNGYMDAEKYELAMPELFSDECDWIREAYMDASLPIGGKSLNFRIGKQQVVWGRTDLFRVLDVINPVDYSRNNIYDELEDIRIPMWIFNAEYRNGATGILDDFNVQLIWNFDKFRPNNLGQAGTPNQILNAGSFFRGMRNLWDNGGTVSNFASGIVTTDFGPHQIGLRDVDMPDWSLSNTQVGVKIEGVLKDFGWSINGMNYRSQLPSLRAGGIPVTSPFTGESFDSRDYLIAFDLYFPRVNLIGGSIDYFSQAIDTVFRVEGAYTEGEEFANTLSPRLFSESPVVRYVFGADKNIFIRAINNTKAFLFSAQIFGQHILDHETRTTSLTGTTIPIPGGSPFLKAGMPDWEANWIATLLIKGWWMNDQLSPQVIMAHDFKAHADVIAPSIEWLISDHWKMNVGFNIKFGRDYDSTSNEWDDARSANMYDPFTQWTVAGLGSGVAVGAPLAAEHQNLGGATVGLAGLEPLGRFRAGPIGMAEKEDEFQFTFQYRF
jgi:hypothetical protein